VVTDVVKCEWEPFCVGRSTFVPPAGHSVSIEGGGREGTALSACGTFCARVTLFVPWLPFLYTSDTFCFNNINN